MPWHTTTGATLAWPSVGSTSSAMWPEASTMTRPSSSSSGSSFIDSGGGGGGGPINVLPVCCLSPLTHTSRPLLSLGMAHPQVSRQPPGLQQSGFQPYLPAPSSSISVRRDSLHGRVYTRQRTPPSSTVTLGMQSLQPSTSSLLYLPQGDDLDEPFTQPHGVSTHYLEQPSMSYSSSTSSRGKESPPPHT